MESRHATETSIAVVNQVIGNNINSPKKVKEWAWENENAFRIQVGRPRLKGLSTQISTPERTAERAKRCSSNASNAPFFLACPQLSTSESESSSTQVNHANYYSSTGSASGDEGSGVDSRYDSVAGISNEHANNYQSNSRSTHTSSPEYAVLHSYEHWKHAFSNPYRLRVQSTPSNTGQNGQLNTGIVEQIGSNSIRSSPGRSSSTNVNGSLISLKTNGSPETSSKNRTEYCNRSSENSLTAPPVIARPGEEQPKDGEQHEEGEQPKDGEQHEGEQPKDGGRQWAVGTAFTKTCPEKIYSTALGDPHTSINLPEYIGAGKLEEELESVGEYALG